MPKSLVIRIISQRAIIITHSLVIFFLIDTTKASKLVGANHIGIALDSFGAVAFGPTEVVEIKLGNTTKEPRLIEPGFHADGLIKVLD